MGDPEQTPDSPDRAMRTNADLGPPEGAVRTDAEPPDPLRRAHRIQEGAREVGFDWAEPMGAWRKVAEELEEVREELEALAACASSDSEGDVGPDSPGPGPGAAVQGDGDAEGRSPPGSLPWNTRDAIRTRLDEELGDLLFAVVNLVRLAGAHAPVVLQGANRKFMARFQRLRAMAHARGIVLGEASLDELDALWDELKRGGAPDDDAPG